MEPSYSFSKLYLLLLVIVTTGGVAYYTAWLHNHHHIDISDSPDPHAPTNEPMNFIAPTHS